jgi:hypothetical protein
MKLITELIESVEILKEDVEGVRHYYIKGIFLQANIKNRNGRVYPMPVLQREVARYVRENVHRSRALGELGHPSGPTINLDRVSHKIEELVQEGENFIGKALVLDTPNGKIVQNLLDAGVQLGVSSRGMGSIRNVNGTDKVQDDFILATPADIVADPSAPDAFVNGIMEGVEWVWDNGILKAERLEHHKKTIDKAASKGFMSEEYESAVMDGFEEFFNGLKDSR